MKAELASGLLPTNLEDNQFHAELRKRKSKDVTVEIAPEELNEYEKRGYKLHKSYRHHLLVKKPKEISERFEDRLWLLFYKMGFSELNPSDFRAPVSTGIDASERRKQIDVAARDGNEVVIVECKASSDRKTSSMRKEIAELATLRQPLEKWAKRAVSQDARVSIILALNNIDISESDRSDAKGQHIVVWEDEEIDYYETLSRLIGSSTKYQLFADLFGNAPFPGEMDFVPAISGLMGQRRFYTFCMTPASLLRIAYVHHRFAHRAGENAYQRMLDKSKLKKISEFLDAGRFFPNNIIVNFTRKPEFSEMNRIGNVAYGYLKPASYYASAWVIDGQHRLYGYANHKRRESDLLQITAFEEMNEEEQGSLFVEINKNQKAVEANLLWDLYSDIYKYSDDPHQQELCVISNIAKRLNRGRNSPFYNRIYIPSQNLKSDDTNVTIQTVCTAIRRNRLLSKDMLFREDYDKTENFAAERIEDFFSFVANRLADDWNKGEGGFSRSNNGIATFFVILREVIRYANFTSADFRRPKWREFIEKTVEPAVRHIEQMDPSERDRLRGRASSEGQRLEVARELAAQIKRISPEFAPTLAAMSTLEREEPEVDSLRNTELALRHFVRERLESKYKEKWYSQGIPMDVKEEIEKRKNKQVAKYPYMEEELRQSPARLLDYTDIAHLGRIITWENNRDLFSMTFRNSEETMKRILEFQDYRNGVMHHREMDDVARKTGKVAAEWIRKCLESAGPSQ